MLVAIPVTVALVTGALMWHAFPEPLPPESGDWPVRQPPKCRVFSLTPESGHDTPVTRESDSDTPVVEVERDPPTFFFGPYISGSVKDDIGSESYIPLSSDPDLNGGYDDTLKDAGLAPHWEPIQPELFTEPRWSYNELGQGTTQIPLYSGRPELIGWPYGPDFEHRFDTEIRQNWDFTPEPKQRTLGELRDRAKQQREEIKELVEERDRLKAEGNPPPNMLEPQAESPSRK